MSLLEPLSQPSLTPSQKQDMRLAASQMKGALRRALQAEMTLLSCRGSARHAATLLVWSRAAIEVVLAAYRKSMLRLGSPSASIGHKRNEEHAPETAKTLRQLAEAHA